MIMNLELLYITHPEQVLVVSAGIAIWHLKHLTICFHFPFMKQPIVYSVLGQFLSLSLR